MIVNKLFSKVLKIEENFKENGKDQDVIEDQLRCIIKYLMYKFIAEKNECTVRDISNKFGIIENTIYKYVNIGVEVGYLKKVNIGKGLKKNGAHFSIATEPKLKEFLDEYENMISTFYHEIIHESKNLL